MINYRSIINQIKEPLFHNVIWMKFINKTYKLFHWNNGEWEEINKAILENTDCINVENNNLNVSTNYLKEGILSFQNLVKNKTLYLQNKSINTLIL